MGVSNPVTLALSLWDNLVCSSIQATVCQMNEPPVYSQFVCSDNDNSVDLENFFLKNLCKAHTSTKLKHTRYFSYDNFTFE